MSTRRAIPNGQRTLCALVLALSALVAMLAVRPAVAAAEECPNAAFRTGVAAPLPDCRAYELVSPSYKDAGLPYWEGYAPDGSSGFLAMGGAGAGLEGFPSLSLTGPIAYFSTSRTPSGWVTAPDDPSASEYIPYLVQGFWDQAGQSLDGQTTFWFERGVWQPENRLDIFKRLPDRSIVDVGPALSLTTPAGNPAEQGENAGLHETGVSDDGSHYFFELESDYWPFDTTQRGTSLYEYVGVGNSSPMLVGVSDGSTVVGGKTLPAGTLLSRCGIELGGSRVSDNSVSSDGDTVFFTARPEQPGCEGPPAAEVFARIDNGQADARTVAISEPTKEDCAACDTEAGVLADAQYVGASEDGSQVFFTTTQPLLGGDTSPNIYEYDFDAPAGQRIVRVTGGDSTVTNPVANELEQTKPLVSPDGSHVYFIAKGVLTTTPDQQGQTAAANANNLYVFERDAAYPEGRTAFIAELSARDVHVWEGERFSAEGSYGDGEDGGDVTPNGRFLVFTSEQDLTPDDTSTARQVFEYDAQSGALTRVSVGENGFNDDGNVAAITNSGGEVVNDAIIETPADFGDGTYSPTTYWHGLSVSADGSYVFFQSPVGLTPSAINDQVIGYVPESRLPIYANNVYEYHGGRVSLISDGQDLSHKAYEYGSNTQLIGTDESGDDVFFTTEDRLVGQDTDTNIDIYDARVDGGFPAPATPPACEGEACQGTLSGAPTLLSPGSEFQAGGNPPLAGAPAAKAQTKKTTKKKSKPKLAKRGKVKKGKRTGGRRAKRARKANRAALGGHAKGRAGR